MNVLKRIGSVASTVLVAVAVVLAVALVGVRVLGFEVFTVLSGSMEPTYETGSVIWVEPREASEIEVGDPISFVLNEDLDVATHRVIEVDAENGWFVTQGDANDAPDGAPVLFENLIGVPVFSVPKLGYFVSYIQTPPGCYVALIVAVAALALMFIPDFFDRREAKAQASSRGRSSRREMSVPRGASARAQARPALAAPAAGSVSFDSLTAEQRAFYAQRELERRRAARAASNQGSSSNQRLKNNDYRTNCNYDNTRR